MISVGKFTRQRHRQVSLAERAAIASALHSLSAERGYAAVRLDDLCQRAAVDRAAFERHFESLEQCGSKIWEEGVHEFLGRTIEAFLASESWRDGMRAAAWDYCAFLQEDHNRSRFFIEFTRESGQVEAKRDFVMARWAELVDHGRSVPGADPDVPAEQAEAIVGAIWERLVAVVRENQFQRLPELIPEGMYLTVLPYLGAKAADEELRRGPADIAAYKSKRAAAESPFGPEPRRVQICEALIAVVVEQGYGKTTVAKVCQRGGLGLAEFERHFADKQDCAERVWEELSDAFIAGLREASKPPGRWPERIRAAALYTFRYFEADVSRSTFFMLGSLSTGEVAQARRDLVVESAIDLVDEGRQELDRPDSLDRATAEGVAGALYEAIVKAVGGGDVAVGRVLLPELIYIVVLPYLGPEAAERQVALAEADIALS